MESAELRVDVVTQGFERWMAGMAHVYREAYQPAPYYVSDAAVEVYANETLPRWVAQPGFSMCIASMGEPIGMAYGWATTPDGEWTGRLTQQLGNDAGYWLHDNFELAELAVRPQFRHRGVGKRLHDSLLASVPHRTALLYTLEEDTPALAMYRHLGWKTLRRGLRLGSERVYLLMGKERGA